MARAKDELSAARWKERAHDQRPKADVAEFFYLDENGIPQDADLHAEMLEGRDPEDERHETERIRAEVRAKHGWSEEALDSSYPLPPLPDPAP